MANPSHPRLTSIALTTAAPRLTTNSWVEPLALTFAWATTVAIPRRKSVIQVSPDHQKSRRASADMVELLYKSWKPSARIRATRGSGRAHCSHGSGRFKPEQIASNWKRYTTHESRLAARGKTHFNAAFVLAS